MSIFLNKIPNISQNLQTSFSTSLENNLSIIIILKTLYRDDEAVILDMYIDDISDTTKIVSGKVLVPDSLICLPNSSINFPYMLRCVDVDGINSSITPKNAHKFYLQFSLYNEDLKLE